MLKVGVLLIRTLISFGLKMYSCLYPRAVSGFVSCKLMQVLPRPFITYWLLLRLSFLLAPATFDQGLIPFSSGNICLGVSSFIYMNFLSLASIRFLLPELNLLEIPYFSGLLVHFPLYICVALSLSSSQ